MNDITLQEAKNPENINSDDIRKYICATATDKEIFMFLNICKMYSLNPFKREVYLVKYGTSNATILVGYEVYLKRAERSENWNGFEVTTEGTIQSGDLKAIVKLWRKDWDHPLIHEVYYDEYVQRKSDGEINKFWREKPRTMIKKVAVSQAFRMAFPDEFSGMPYTQEEMNNVEYTNGESEPKFQIPKPKSEITVDTVKKDVIKPLEIITEDQGKNLLKISKDNGWSKEDLLDYGRSLGYTKLREINEKDYQDFIEYFSKDKDQYLKEIWSKEDVKGGLLHE